MNRYANFVIKHRKIITAVFVLAALTGFLLSLGVRVNYNLVDYLPPSAPSTKALDIINEEFDESIPNASVMVRDVSLPEALEYKERISSIDGVSGVIWLDDVTDVTLPLQTQDTSSVEEFYKNGNALFSITIEPGIETKVINAIREVIGEGNAITGEAPDKSYMESAAENEVLSAVAILLPIILIILILSTTSWLEPLLFLIAIGVSILINMGTNLFFEEISFVTNSVSPILQLAVSLDYAIFLLHSFADYRKECDDVEEAMRLAIKKSVSAVAASATTTLFGFIALVFMEMGIGADLGINLAKGILFSFVSCMVFLPALTICVVKLLDKSRHRELLPSFSNANRFFSKIAFPALALVLLLVVPGYLGQAATEFTYGMTDENPDSRNWQENHAVWDEFGQSNVMAVLVPKGDIVKEYELGQDLLDIDHVDSVVSYATAIGTGIPADFLDPGITDQFYSENYARLIVYTDTDSEGDVAFSTVEAVHDKVRQYYGESFHSIGQSVNLYDMKNVVSKDNVLVNLIAIIAIFAVLLINFRSATLPFLLLFTIEVGIWINLAIPYFTGGTINFLGYLVINTVQLGATVDYAILLTTYYLDNRKWMDQKQAIHKSIGQTFKPILVSGTVLSIAGFTLSMTSSNPVVAGLGLLLGRGTIFSVVMVLCLLPVLLRIFDKAIGATTYKANFFGKQKTLRRQDR